MKQNLQGYSGNKKLINQKIKYSPETLDQFDC